MGKSLKFIDWFSGIGGFRLGMERAGHTCVGYVEIDKHARKSYEAIYNVEGEWTEHDVTKVDYKQIPRADVWCLGFPCQDISVASSTGKGLQGARSGLFYTIIELIKSQKEEDKPSYLFIENVKNLFSVNGGWDFARVLISLDEAGYDAEWNLLNSKHFGVPQSRERTIIIGHLRGRCTRKVFPIRREGSVTTSKISVVGTVENIKGHEILKRVYNPEGISPTLHTMSGGNTEPKILLLGNINPSNRGMSGRVLHPKGISPTLTASDMKEPLKIVHPVLTPDRINKRQNGRRFKGAGEPMFTLTTQDTHGVAILNVGQLQCDTGQTGRVFDRAAEVGVSNSQLL